MNFALRLSILIACALPLAACSQMNVRVSILDRNFLSSPEAAENIANQRVPAMAAWAIDARTIDNSLAKIEPSVNQALLQSNDLLTQIAAIDANFTTASAAERREVHERAMRACAAVIQSIDADRRDGLRLAYEARSMPRATSNEMEARQNHFHAAVAKFNSVDAAMLMLDSLLVDAAAAGAQAKLRENSAKLVENTLLRRQQATDALATATPDEQRILSALITRLSDTLADIEELNDTITATVAREVAATAPKATATLQADTGYVPPTMSILDDPNASLVVYAPDRYWRGEYNRAFACGNGGNSDIAIVMQGPGSFSVKGLRNDTSKITAATFNVLKTSLVIASSVAGAPIPDLKPKSADGKVKDGVLDERLVGIANAGQAEAASRAQLREVRKEFASLAEIIVSQNTLISADASAPNALVNIKSAFASAKKRLTPPPPAQ